MSKLLSAESTPPGRQVPSAAKFGEDSGRTPRASTKVDIFSGDGLNNILANLRGNDSRKSSSNPQPQSFERVIHNLNDTHRALKRQEMQLKDSSSYDSFTDIDDSSGGSDQHPSEALSRQESNSQSSEIQRLKQELEAARAVVNEQNLELAESRSLKHTMEQAMGPASESDFSIDHRCAFNANGSLHSNFNAAARPFTAHSDTSWSVVDDSRSDHFSAFGSYGQDKNFDNPLQVPGINTVPTSFSRNARFNNARFGGFCSGPQTSPVDTNFPSGRAFSGMSPPVGVHDSPFHATSGLGLRRNTNLTGTSSTFSDPMSPPIPYTAPLSLPYSSQFDFSKPAGSINPQISPVNSEFPAGMGQPSMIPSTGPGGQQFITTMEPMNYRRLLDKSVSCDWKYIVDKIVCSNDQQASIFLQQKLKVGTVEQKFEIVESIINQAYPLMINRFGNFLVQRCFEHGTPDQVVAIADAIHGNVISLSMDPFGCHVIQKAFDSVPETHKAGMVRELLRRIPDTVIHRYACHVWQKLFELRWSGEPPQIMLKVNEALRGMWHEVALGETGSLVVQNIFENCVEEEKRPAIEEVIANIDLIAHGQFGNWCIQHLCEHGSPPDKRQVIDHILTNAYNYSIDQFASKVVEKCLKISGLDFLDRFLAVITTARPDRPRIPLIDIAGDQYGNYLVQWILTNAPQAQRDQVSVHIRKHMVSLRGSKFGSRVAMLCSNPAAITRSGPATALINPYGVPGHHARQGYLGRYRG